MRTSSLWVGSWEIKRERLEVKLISNITVSWYTIVITYRWCLKALGTRSNTLVAVCAGLERFSPPAIRKHHDLVVAKPHTVVVFTSSP
jgi:hypothetical protein